MTRRPVRVLVAGHDFGGLNLLAPLLRAWQEDDRIVAAFVSTPAVCREMSAQVPCITFPKWVTDLTEYCCASPQTLDTYLHRWVLPTDWDVVLCSTSRLCLLEKRLIKMADSKGIPTVAFCDMWWAYEERFRDGSEWCIPRTVLVLDERMRDDIERVEWPKRPRTEIVGSPLFQELMQIRSVGEVGVQGAIRFISEPASSKFPWSRIDEFELADQVVETTRGVGIMNRIVIRPHPTDPIEQWRRWAWRLKEQDVQLDAMPLEQCIADTALALGISSILLSEMAVCGVPTASLQWPDTEPSYYCLPFSEFSIAILHSPAELGTWLLASNGKSVPRSPGHLHKDAIARITELTFAAVGGTTPGGRLSP